MKIPFVDLFALHEPLLPELEAAIRRVVVNSSFVLGPEVEAFEEAFARHVGVRHVIGTSSGTSALQVGLMALGIRPGDEVVVPAMTFYATAEAAALLGARPVFVDIDPKTLTIDPAGLERVITPRTRVVIPVHLHGHPADMGAVSEVCRGHDIRILEDCAHAHGATIDGRQVGSFGALGAFSFYPSKNLGAFGEAGAITTNHDRLAERCRAFRDHGSLTKFQHEHVGLNGRMPAIEAAVLRVKLPHLHRWNTERRRVASCYREILGTSDVLLPFEDSRVEHVYHVFQVQLANRNTVFGHLQSAGIGVNMHYPVPLHLQPGFTRLGYRTGSFPVAETLAARTLSLPCHPTLSRARIEQVAESLFEGALAVAPCERGA
jgi:dTDP-4-amino-4,6-dideoxygalactose transaminase